MHEKGLTCGRPVRNVNVVNKKMCYRQWLCTWGCVYEYSLFHSSIETTISISDRQILLEAQMSFRLVKHFVDWAIFESGVCSLIKYHIFRPNVAV